MNFLNRPHPWFARGLLAALLFGSCAVVIAPSCGDDTVNPDQCPLAAAHDHCPGEPVSVSKATTEFRSASMPCDWQDTVLSCTAEQGGPELFYEVTPAANGTLRVTQTGDTFGTLFVYAYGNGATRCDPPFKALACQEIGDLRNAMSMYLEVSGGLHYLVGYQESRGVFHPAEAPNDSVLVFELKDAECGNGFQEATEQCDFGLIDNEASGCSTDCKTGTPPADSDTCPGEPHNVLPGTPVVLTGYTSGFTPDVEPCGALAGGPDRVFRFTPVGAGTFTVKLTEANFDAVLAVYGKCPSGGLPDVLLRCSDASAIGSESVSLPVVNTMDYWIVVDGYGPADFGKFTLTVNLN